MRAAVHSGLALGLAGVAAALLPGAACRTDSTASRPARPDATAPGAAPVALPRADGGTRPTGGRRPRVKTPALVDVRAVTRGTPFYQRPRFTPDGKRVAVSLRRFAGIHLVDLASGRAEVVTRDAGAGYAYAFSPDRRRLAYRAARTVGGQPRWAAAVYELATRRRVVLTGYAHGVGFPFFSADGRHVLYTLSGSLWQVPVGGGAPKVVARGLTARHLRWLPGRRRLLSDEDRAVVASAPDGTRRQAHFEGAGFFGPVVSPDRRAYLVHESRGRQGHLWVYDLARRTRRDLGVGYAGAFLPGSDWVVFQRNRNDGRRFTSADLWAVTLDGGARTRLTRTADRLEADPTASPDGRRLAFTDARTGILYAGRVELR